VTFNPYAKTNQYIIDGAIFGAAFGLAYALRFEGNSPPAYVFQFWLLLPGVIAGRLATSAALGTYRRMWRYVSLDDVFHLGLVLGAFSSVLLLLRFLTPERWTSVHVPVGIISLDFLMALFGTLAVRVLRRLTHHRGFSFRPNHEKRRSVLLVGAGSAGAMTARELAAHDGWQLVGFLDDDLKKIGAVISGVAVLGPLRRLPELVRERQVDEVVVCIARAPRAVLKQIWQLCEGLKVRVSIIPTREEILEGEVQVTRLRQISMEDLLGRETVEVAAQDPTLEAFFRGKRVLITGAGGSIGSELARQLATLGVERLLLLDKDENCLHDLHVQFAAQTAPPPFELLVADVRARERLGSLFRTWRPQIVFHAAAHKHVPLMEANPGEAILNNVFGTRHVIDATTATGGELLVFISTDKAVRPTSIMGASKRLGELLIRAQAGRGGVPTRFVTVRFGNVMNSRGSVIPLFQQQIAAGGPITLTDPAVTRYFMTIPEAVHLVIQAGLLEQPSGSVFVLDMGNPVRVADLARDLIELSSLRPEQDIRIETIGLRPGEKLHEELVDDGEALLPAEHPRIFVIRSEVSPTTSQLDTRLERLWQVSERGQVEAIYSVLEEMGLGLRRGEALARPGDGDPAGGR